MGEMDPREAERLVETYSDLILRLSYTYLKSVQDGEDICQTVLLKLLTGDEQFDSPEHEKAWVIRATANACKDGAALPNALQGLVKPWVDEKVWQRQCKVMGMLEGKTPLFLFLEK